jgi:hypothetical protein
MHLHGIAEALSWCHHSLVVHDGHLTPLGLASLLLLVVAATSMTLVRRRQRRLRADNHGDPLVVVASDDAMAFALPGKPGQVVVTTSMLDALDADEQRVLFAHEQAHLRLRHHRYLRLTQLASAACPLVYPLVKRVRFATERWADEEAAKVVEDRELVARTIARAALAAEPLTYRMALAESDVASRVRALLGASEDASRPRDMVAVAGMLTTMAGATALVVYDATSALLGTCA